MGAKSLGDGKKRPLARAREIIKARERALAEKEVKNMTFIEQRNYLDNRMK